VAAQAAKSSLLVDKLISVFDADKNKWSSLV
jgi:hypothetical protein